MNVDSIKKTQSTFFVTKKRKVAMRKNNMKTIEEKLEMINRYKSSESATKIAKENAINKRRTN